MTLSVRPQADQADLPARLPAGGTPDGRGGGAAAEAPLGWAIRGAEVAAELNRTAGALRGHLGLIERECASLRSQLRRRPARHRLGPPPTDLADQLMISAAAARRRLDVVEHQCDDVVIKARRVQQPALAAATAGHIGELSADLDQQAAAARARLTEGRAGVRGPARPAGPLLAEERLGQPDLADQESLLSARPAASKSAPVRVRLTAGRIVASSSDRAAQLRHKGAPPGSDTGPCQPPGKAFGAVNSDQN